MNPAGKFRHRLTFLRPEKVVDSFGQEMIELKNSLTVWGMIAGNGGGTSLVLGRGQITYSHTVTVRDCSELAGVNEIWRVRFGFREFSISSVFRNHERPGEEIVLTCNEEVLVQ